MSDREQLLELKNDLARQIGFECAMFRGKSSDEVLRLIDRLLARFPYEPGERINVRMDGVDPWLSREFIAANVEDGGVWCLVDPDGRKETLGKAMYWNYHCPMPKTKTLEVPEEIIEMAHEVRAELIDSSNDSKIDKIIEWLAREAGRD